MKAWLKRLLFSALLLLGVGVAPALAQCSGVFAANEVCGSVSGGVPGPAPASDFTIGGNVGTVTNVSALLANTVAYTTIHLQGYYAAADGGGGDLEESASCTANGVTDYTDAAGHCYTRTNANPLNVLWGGVKRDGSTDNTTTARNVYNVAFTTGNQVFWPWGTYCINSGIPLSGAYVRSTGAAMFATIIENCGSNDDPIFDVTQGYSYFEHMAIIGLNNVSSVQPTVKYENSAVRGTLDDVLIYYGAYPLYNLGGSVQVYNSILSYGFQGNLYSDSGDLIVDNTFLDVPQPYGSFPSTMANWSASRSTVANYILKLSGGTVLQYSANCTTGGSQPTVVGYQQNITDGTCTAQIFGPPEMGVIDSGSSVNYINNTDVSGAAWAAGFLNNGSSTSLINSTVQPFGNAIYLNGGSQIHLINDFGNSSQTGASGLTTTGSFGGDLMVESSWFSGSTQGLNLSGGTHIQLTANGTEGNGTALVINGATYVQSTGNNWGGSSSGPQPNTTGISIAVGANHFHSVNDDASLAGTAVVNSSTNTDISFDNLAGYSAYGTTPPTLSTCGTSPSVGAGSYNKSGTVTTGTATPGACTVTFGVSYPNNANCTIAPANSAAHGVSGGSFISAQSKSAFTITQGAGTSSAAYSYTCDGN